MLTCRAAERRPTHIESAEGSQYGGGIMRVSSGAWGAGILAVLLSGVSMTASAQGAAPAVPTDDARIAQLEAEVASLAAEVTELRAEQIQTVSAAPSPKASPSTVIASLTGGKPEIATADGRFTANFHGILQLDAAQYIQDAPGPLTTDLRRSGPALGATAANVDLVHARELKSGTDVRRARIGVDGTAFEDWDYRLIFDFGGTGVENAGQLYEGWLQYSGLAPLHLRIGAYAPSIGLEDQASPYGMPLLERSVVEDIARGLAAGETRTAASIWGAGSHWLVSAAVTGRTIGVLSAGTASPVPQTFGDQLGFVGRVAGTPLSGPDWLVHVGAHGSYVARPANTGGPGALGPAAPSAEVVALSNTPEVRVDGTKLINTGNIDARNASSAGLEFAAQKQNLLVQSEYEQFSVGRTDIGLASPSFHGFYVEGDWVITGERRAYNTQTAAFDAPPVAHPFSWSGGGLGAVELVARYSDTDLNFDAGALGTAPRATRSAAARSGTGRSGWTGIRTASSASCSTTITSASTGFRLAAVRMSSPTLHARRSG